MTEANWVYDLPTGLLIGGLIIIIVGIVCWLWISRDDYGIEPKHLPLPGCFIVIGFITMLIGGFAPNSTYFTRDRYDIEQMAEDYNAVIKDRKDLRYMNLSGYEDTVLVRTEAFGHECWTYYIDEYDEYAAYRNE